MDLFSDTKILTVSELTKQIKNLLEVSFDKVYVEGEISNVSVPVSGHTYFTLKDKDSQISAVLFKFSQKKIKFTVEDGLNVICCGRVTVYGPRGQYQIVVENIEPKGFGKLQLAFEQLKEKLAKEGLFDEKFKKPIPFLPGRIGIVTSATGKAIQDILNVINRRFSNLEILLMPVKVQGQDACKEIADAIEAFNRYKKVDVIITGRGGGSLEDLWAFNEEIVARAIFNSQIPVISAVGHEPDVTISDLTADLRAPTPSAAAELVIEKKEQIQEYLNELFSRLNRLCLFKTEMMKSDLEKISGNYLFKHPDNFLLFTQQKLDDISKTLNSAAVYFMDLQKEKFKSAVSRLNTLNPLSILSRGYSVTTEEKTGKIILDAGQVKKGDIIKTRLQKSIITSEVQNFKGE